MRKVAWPIFILVLVSFLGCRKDCSDCEIIDSTNNISQKGKACDSQFVEKCQTLARRYKNIECTCEFQR
jgi:hypothetical protein